MKVIFTLLLFISLVFITGNTSADSKDIQNDDTRANVVVPNAYTGVTGTSSFTGPLGTAPRTYQLLIQSSQLIGLAGRTLTGYSMRLPASATSNWPVADVNFSNYDIYLSASVEPAARSLTFANNIVGAQTQVRSGSLTILANSYTFGSSPNAFGPTITFTTPYYYGGGNLLVEIRHPGFTGTSRSTDALSTSTGGYGTLISGCWTGNYTGTTGAQGNFTVLNFTATDNLVLQLNALIEGLYSPGPNTMVSDTARVHLRNDFSPYSIVETSTAVLGSNGFGAFPFTAAVNGVSYYLVVDQRNSINTWSAAGNTFSGNVLLYDFTTAANKAFGSNQALEGTEYCIYSGDVNKDGAVDGSDLSLIDNAAFNFLTGYVPEDLNGDEIVDGSDGAICDVNSSLFVSEARP